MSGIGIKSVLSRLLKIAVANGVENAIKVHITKGDDLNARDEAGNTPLMIAASKNRASTCKLLLENGADALLQDSSGKTAAMIADEVGALEAAQVIRSLCPEFSFPDEPEETISLPTTASTSTLQERIPEGTSESLALDDDDGEWDFGDWEPEIEAPPPTEDPEFAAKARNLQKAISEHRSMSRYLSRPSCRRRLFIGSRLHGHADHDIALWIQGHGLDGVPVAGVA